MAAKTNPQTLGEDGVQTPPTPVGFAVKAPGGPPEVDGFKSTVNPWDTAHPDCKSYGN